MKNEDWRTDPKEAARVLLKKIDNTERSSFVATNIEAGFDYHHGKLTCGDYELLKLLANAVLKQESNSEIV